MEHNKDPNNTIARTLTCVQFPRWYVWKLDKRIWVPRKKENLVSRIHSVSPSIGEAYFLRILLNKVKGPTSFYDIKTVNGRVYDTFRDACYALGLLDDDSEYVETIKEANISSSASYIRNLFATMLLSSSLSRQTRPELVWERTWKYMTDGFVYRLSKYHRVAGTASLDNFSCRLINKELAYDRTNLQNVYEGQLNMLTDEQHAIFEDIIQAVDGNNGGMFFVYGYGGTGKTFLWKTLHAEIRSKGEIVLNVASRGIASLLLDGGRMAHSRFHIPLNLNEDSVCHIKPDDDVAKLLNETKLIIWAEAPMVHKHAFEALDRTMHDIFNIENSRKSDILFGEINNFAKWLLDVGEGNVGGSNDGEVTIEIPPDLLIDNTSYPISCLIDFVYPLILDNFNDRNYFSDRAILAPKNEVVHEINDKLLSLFADANPTQQRIYSPDVLNGLKVSGLPNHRLVLKVGVPILLLRNTDQQNGLCNDTRLKVTKLYNLVIEAEIISGGNIGTRTFIAGVNLIPSDGKIPFAFQRRQFPIAVCFAMTINKSQGQSLSKVE
ncbi:uncharacterized protein LOC110893324 [Helianthus annuus]|uniref:uncharacterized protein LOC110893324 n=1 Tax=Helianthus annuus TaxID=4232 RepID=UPI000B8F6270|nr:uncharacterized protein LOC110893324 [Helianthus annuus]